MKKNELSKSTFSRLAHIGIVVRNMDKTIKRLESLGIGPFKPFDPASFPPLVGKLKFRGKPFDIDNITMTAKMGNIELEMFEPHEKESPWTEFLETKGEGIHHMAFIVDNLEKEVNKLTKQGATILLGSEWLGGGGAVYLDFNTGGIIVELMQL